MVSSAIDTRPTPVHKTFFDLSKGLVTELTPLGMPGGTTIAEANFEILRDGTRRRRRGVSLETGGETLDFNLSDASTPTPTSTFAHFRWGAVNNNPDLVFIVAKLGTALHFWNEGDTLSSSKIEDTVDLMPYTSYGDSGAAYEYVADEDITMASMHGRLFVTGKTINPFYVSYNETTELFTVTQLVVRIRDLVGIEDSAPIGEKPAALSESHNYNLANRGWNSTTMGYYYAGQLADGTITSSKYPAKNQIWWKALVRWSDNSEYQNGMSDINKLRVFDTSAIEQEVWGTVSAPQGHLFLNPFDTRVGTTDGVEDITEDKRTITAVSLTSTGPTVNNGDGTYTKRLRLKLTLNNDTTPANSTIDWTAGTDITLNGTVIKLNLREAAPGGGYKTINVDLSGYKFDIVGEAPDTPTVTYINIDYIHTGALLQTVGDYGPLYNSTVSGGYASKGGFYVKSTGYSTPLRPRATATFAGRVWLAGCDHPELSDTIFFSQVGSSTVDGAKAYSKMYQAGDPTSEYLNMVQPTDGGTIQIAGLSGVKALVPLSAGILVLSSAGIWEISGGDAYFSATSIQVRKLSDAEVVSPKAWAFTDHGMFVASPRGLFKIEDNEQSGRLGIGSITVDTIQTYWQTIAPDNFPHMQLLYDNSLYRLYVMFKRLDTANWKAIDEALVYDLRYTSFYDLVFPKASGAYIHGAVVINDVSSSNDNKKLKFFVIKAGLSVQLDVCDMAHLDYVDFDGEEQIPFIETGYDGIGEGDYRGQSAAQDSPDHHTFKYSPYVYVHMRTTEYGIDPETEEVLNPSSLFMSGRYDFTSSAVTGKHGTTQQVYRPRYDGTGLPTGYSVVTSKSRVRGRGRALSLKFVGEAGHDAHLVGYSIEYSA